MDGGRSNAGPREPAHLNWRAATLASHAPLLSRELRGHPLPAVLDTCCVRTGLHYQLRNGQPPASVRAAIDGHLRLYMERTTLEETFEKLPVFSAQLRVSTRELIVLFTRDWLPHIRVVVLPPDLRSLDLRAEAVRKLDADDYPAAALAALLSPCILLTGNHRHFAPLGVKGQSQGVDAALAAVDLNNGATRLQALTAVPVMPALAAWTGIRWAESRVGRVVWIALAIAALLGVVRYRDWKTETKRGIKEILMDVGLQLVDEFSQAAAVVTDAQERLEAYVIPAPAQRTVEARVLRELATAQQSLSAQQLHESLHDDGCTPTEKALRAWLHAHKTGLFQEVRRGGFVLGYQYRARRCLRPRPTADPSIAPT